MEYEVIHTTIGGCILILLAYGMFEYVYLYLTGFLS